MNKDFLGELFLFVMIALNLFIIAYVGLFGSLASLFQ